MEWRRGLRLPGMHARTTTATPFPTTLKHKLRTKMTTRPMTRIVINSSTHESCRHRKWTVKKWRFWPCMHKSSLLTGGPGAVSDAPARPGDRSGGHPRLHTCIWGTKVGRHLKLALGGGAVDAPNPYSGSSLLFSADNPVQGDGQTLGAGTASTHPFQEYCF